MNVPEDSYVDLLRKASGCPDGKSLRLHIEALRARLAEVEAENDDIRSSTMDYTHEIEKLTDRATRAEAERDEARAKCEMLKKVRKRAQIAMKSYRKSGSDKFYDDMDKLDATLAECREVE